MAATLLQVGQFLDSPDWSESEKWVIKWQFGMLGEFHTRLAKAIQKADHKNMARLAAGFPAEVAGYEAWANGDLGERLRKAGLGI